jgi:hypothetical protein
MYSFVQVNVLLLYFTLTLLCYFLTFTTQVKTVYAESLESLEENQKSAGNKNPEAPQLEYNDNPPDEYNQTPSIPGNKLKEENTENNSEVYIEELPEGCSVDQEQIEELLRLYKMM